MSTEPEKSIIHCIRDFIKECPYLPEFHRSVGVDYLAPDIQSYMIEAVPCNPIVKTYISGSIRQYQFNFCSRESYSVDVRDNMENSMFYEHFQEWLEKCSNSGDLPVLTGGKVAQKIAATTHGYVYDASDQQMAQYMIQCSLTYFCPY